MDESQLRASGNQSQVNLLKISAQVDFLDRLDQRHDSTRSLEDINTVLEYAKLERAEVKPVIQSIYFSEHLDNEPVKLLEVDNNVLESLKTGQTIVIRGDKDEGAVLCTDDKTYDIKEAEISNSMLLVPGLVCGDSLHTEGSQDVQYKQVTTTLYNYFELRPCKPRLKKLKQLLEENMFSGKECENDEHHQGKQYTFTELLDVIQASELEIKTALHKLEACLLDGHWRLLDFDFLTQVLNHIIQLCEENDWLTDGIPKEDCCQTLEELFPRIIIEHVLNFHADIMKATTHSNDDEEENKMEIDTTFYMLNEDKICRFFAKLCLKNAGKFNLKEFLGVWEQCVPSSMKTSLVQLEGMALIDRSCKPERIWYFPVEDLPEDVDERFNFLFRTREKWTLDEITPFIRDLTTEKIDVGALLTKHARTALQSGIKMFNSRKPVT